MTREINAGERDPTSARQEWRTPRALAARIVERWAIDLDVMADADNRVVPRFIGMHGADDPDVSRRPVAIDALQHPWHEHGRSIFVNPPFALIAPVTARALHAAFGGATIVMLAPDNGDTRWYAAWVDAGAVVLRFRGRVAYEPSGGVIAAAGRAAFPSALYVLTPAAEPRRVGAPVPTWCIDPSTLDVL